MTQAEAKSKGIEIGKDVIVPDTDETQDTDATDEQSKPDGISDPQELPIQLKKKTIVKVVDSGYNPPRQDHCFVYLVYKTPKPATNTSN